MRASRNSLVAHQSSVPGSRISLSANSCALLRYSHKDHAIVELSRVFQCGVHSRLPSDQYSHAKTSTVKP